MSLRKVFTFILATTTIVALADFAVARSPNDQSQGGEAPTVRSPAPQGGGGDDATLEIAPQPGARPPRPSVTEIPGDRNFRPGENSASIDPNFRQRSEDRGDVNGRDNNGEMRRSNRRPLLGLTVTPSKLCYLGMEEEGLQIVTIDPGGPAEKAGLQAQSGMTAMGAAVATLSGILPGGTLIANKALSSTGSMGQAGDLIVAIDDNRVRSQGDLDAAMAQLKPGDTAYLTVIRPYGSGHKTLKVPVRVGAVGEPIANAAGYPH